MVEERSRALNLDIGPLRKILELEKSKGCTDTAVIGGLDRYLQQCIKDAQRGRNAASPQLHSVQLPNTSYATLTQEQRKQWVQGVLAQIAEVDAVTAGKIHKHSPGAVRYERQSSDTTTISLESPITALKGISKALTTRFDKLGVKTVRDMLYFFPRRHLDYSKVKQISELESGVEQTIIATVWQTREVKLGYRRGTEAILSDGTGTIRVVWFNQPYLARKLRINTQLAVSGKVSLFKGRNVFESPEWEPLSSGDLIHTGRLIPIYPLTEGMRARSVRKLIKEVIGKWVPQMTDFLPTEVRNRCQLLDLAQAIEQAHYPDSESSKEAARSRLAFDELFLIQLGVLSKKIHWQEGQTGIPLPGDLQIRDKFLDSLPFSLTSAQWRVLNEILSDIGTSKPMSRLLQGEVGSGKTVVATTALLMTVASGCQGALMAPTEILAEQHFNTISQLLSRAGQRDDETKYIRSYTSLLPGPITIALLVGDISEAEKQELRQYIADGKINIIIGTHALIQKGVEFKRLGLAVIDEQHRFGVMQRSALRQRGENPHILVMTATPIPRSLALTLYGDLDLSIINELPPERQPIKTQWLKPEQREQAYSFIRRKIAEGRQAFIICPLIEESEKIESKAAITEYRRLSREVFPDLRLGLLHGRMSAQEKEAIMHYFRDGELNILVSTAVVEVGIDVPNATVMLVEGAERFGLSQLHQFRGRVGRGRYPSYCLLLAESPSAEGEERLSIIESTYDGFALAEEDLRLRGPGEFFGTRQSGLPDLHMARLTDTAILELAREEATRILRQDPNLEQIQHHLLSLEMKRLWKNDSEWS